MFDSVDSIHPMIYGGVKIPYVGGKLTKEEWNKTHAFEVPLALLLTGHV